MEVDHKVPDAVRAIALDVPEYFFYLLFQAQRRRDMTFDAALAEGGLNITRWRTLSVIRRLDECTMKDLAGFTAIDRTTLTRSVDQLVEQGLVNRATPPGDRRKVVLTLTEAGDTFFQAAIGLLDAFNREALEGVSAERQLVVLDVLQTVLRNLCEAKDQAEEILTFGGRDRHRALA
ncbi:MAG TPA: MarR family transcriptional regulator [Caulobacteraceae bacterium]